MASILNFPLLPRNYGSIQTAYQNNNANLSMRFHEENKENNDNQDKDNKEKYHEIVGSDVVKSIIFGGLDGIITTFSIICSSYASHLSVHTIMVLGFANVLADAISMGHGDYFSEKTEQDYIKDQYNREKWEMDNYPQGEIDEMVDIYVDKYNISRHEANSMLTTMSNYKDLFVDHMMVLELDLMPPSDNQNPYKNGLVTFFSFLFFGSIPLIFYLLSENIYYAISSTIITLGFLGWVRSYFTKTNKFYSCFITILNGGISAGAAYGVSYALDYYLM